MLRFVPTPAKIHLSKKKACGSLLDHLYIEQSLDASGAIVRKDILQ